MKKGVTAAGLGEVGGIEHFLKKAAQFQFDAIDVSGSELVTWVEEIGLEAAQEQLQQHEVEIGAINLSVEWRQGEDDFIRGLSSFTKEVEVASQLGCRTCVTYILPSTDYQAAVFMAKVIRRLRTCAVILKQYNMKLGLEFVGPHHLRTAWKYPFIWTASDTIELIETIGEPNVGLLIDVYHCYTTGLKFAELKQIPIEHIVHVHINDAKAIPVPELLDNDRLYPGEGVIDIVGFLKQLHDIGYQGAVAQEVLTQNPPKLRSEELLKKTAKAYQELFNKAGI